MWILSAIIAAFSWATSDLINKMAMNKGESEYTAIISRFLWSTPLVFLAYILNRTHIPPLEFWFYLIAVIFGDIIASLLYMKALKIGEISLVAPLTSFAPIFMAIVSTIVLREPPTTTALVGIILVFLGSYSLGTSGKTNLTEPIKKVLLTRAGIYTIIAAFIFSIDTSIAKISLNYTDIFSFSFWYTLLFLISAVILKKIKSRSIGIKRIALEKRNILIGTLFGIGTISFMNSIQQANISYVSAIGKLNMLISVIYGKIFFKEQNFAARVFGTVVIIVGVILVIFSSK